MTDRIMARLLADDLQARCGQLAERVRVNALASLVKHRSGGRRRRIPVTFPVHLEVKPAILLRAHANAPACRSMMSDYAASVRLLFYTEPDGTGFVGLFDIRNERAYLAKDDEAKPLRDLFATLVWNGTLGSAVH